MTFKISQERLKELAKIEAEIGCDVEAGLNLGTHAGEYLASVKNYVDRDSLLTVLNEGLSQLLSPEDIEAIANELQIHTETLVTEKLQATKSA